MKAFKIKNKDGLFSTGGHVNTKFTSRGKMWGSFQAIKLHLRQFCSDAHGEIINGEYKYVRKWINNIPEDWIVVELSEEGIKEYSAKALYKETE